MAVGSVLGSGILVLPAVTAEQAGPASLISWVVMSILAIPLAFSLGRLATRVPSAGGIAALLIAAVVAASPKVDSNPFHPFLPNGWVPVGSAAVAIFWCFVGWEMVAHLAEEFKNPKRDVFVSLSIAPILVGILYVGIALGTDLTAFLALLVTFGGLHMNIAGFSHMVYAQASEGDFPKRLAYLHQIYKTPVVALLGLSAVFTVVLLINGFFHPNLGAMIQWPSVVFLALYMVAMCSALKHLPREDLG